LLLGTATRAIPPGAVLGVCNSRKSTAIMSTIW
jgi:hypothetical protein